MKISNLVAICSTMVSIPSSKGDTQSRQNQRIRTLSSRNKNNNRLTTTTSTRKIKSEDDSFDDDIDYFYSMSYNTSYDQSTSKDEDDSLDDDNGHFYSMSYSYSYNPTSDSIPDMSTVLPISNKISTDVPSTYIDTQPQVETNVPTITNVILQTNDESISDASDTVKSTIPSVAPNTIASTDQSSASIAAFPETNDDESTIVSESKANTRSKSLTNGVAAAAGLVFAGVVLAMIRQWKQSPSDDLDEDFTEADFI
eukprot:CAMPEP_0194279830 /NCGR_PEP_ID=MMETSP0169-20130528/14151_1 /TAXON_ID=218684 /ORGANISM="Corethron pennatum, Strain L29A3" /LENGTH=254 /DNA_ID=CAMNT_0039024301 /DNA_START=53 /DNA_END=817 /DNA_ORIENTATION=+